MADSVYTYLRNAVDVKVFEHGGKIYAVVASNSDSVHLLDITDPANINELRHPNPESQSGSNNFNNAPGGESAVPYVAIDGNLYIMLSWSTSDAIQSFYIHSNGAAGRAGRHGGQLQDGPSRGPDHLYPPDQVRLYSGDGPDRLPRH